MEQFIYYLKVSLKGIKRAPLPYALTIFILSVGLGVFFANATFYYQLNSDPLPQKSDKLFFPMLNLVPFECTDCKPPHILSYANVQKLSQSDIPNASAAMYSANSYAKLQATQPPLPVQVRITQRDFFTMFNVPVLHGSIWPDNAARDEVILGKNMAEKLYGRSNAVGETLLLDEVPYRIVAVLDKWQMLPRLYDASFRNYLNPTEEIFMPLETGYDRNYQSNTSSMTYDDTDFRKMATEGRTGARHILQYWVQLDTQSQQQAYRQFMLNLVQSEKAAGRHPSIINNQLVPMTDIVRYFNVESSDIKAFALVTMLFLLVCLFNASHLTLNRYLSNQFDFSLRRALGASRAQLQLQMLADVLMTTLLTIIGSLLIGYTTIQLMNRLLPSNNMFSSWDLNLIIALFTGAFISCYLVSLYPSLRASFGSLNQQLKE